MARAFGIPGQHNTPTKKTTIPLDGHKVSYTRKTWHGNPIGWKVWVDGVKYFSNLLTSKEAVESCVQKYLKEVGQPAKEKPQNCYSCPDFTHITYWRNIPWCLKLNRETNGLAPVCTETD